ncbi:hypothetical protein EVAR_88304_1 [Eumeta japonica]|uniref:Uncharacterized protein n=1 Tax=Eumeta variegata TaxID=151549 RepID=A0A4C1VMA2_EUMVA|nr:hypothetical protein EVAR_88304_1 [Eumeta japonica]
MLKPQFYQLIKLHKDELMKFQIDKLLTEKGYDILLLSPYHPDLKSIELACAAIKGYCLWKMKPAYQLTNTSAVADLYATRFLGNSGAPSARTAVGSGRRRTPETSLLLSVR